MSHVLCCGWVRSLALYRRYLMSDGLADDPMQCMDFIEARIRHQQRVPVIHAVRAAPAAALTLAPSLF